MLFDLKAQDRSILYFHMRPWAICLRVFGVGLLVAWERNYVPLFSERYGYVYWWRIGPVRIKVLGVERRR